MTFPITDLHRAAPAGCGNKPGYSMETWIVDDAYDLCRKSARWDVSCQQLSPGRFSGRVCELWLQSIQVVQESCNQSLLESGQSWKTSLTFVAFRPHGGSGRYFGTPLCEDHAYLLSSDDEIDIRTPEGFERTSVTIGAEVLGRYLSHHEKDVLTSKVAHGSISVVPGAAGPLHESLSSVLSAISASPGVLSLEQARRTLEESIVSAILDDIISPNAGTFRERPIPGREAKIVRCAREYIVAHTAEEPITVADLCRHLNVSRRTLQYCFENLLNVSPSAYLRLLRLNAAHRDLKLASPVDHDVTHVATRWGFWHLARFSMYYKRLFGEYPSETLRNSARKS